MARIIRASWDDFRRIVESAHEHLLICVPYYSKEGLRQLSDVFYRDAQLNFISRLSPSDWLSGVSDPKALLAWFEFLRRKNRSPLFTIHQQLHAKAYLADLTMGLVGSANLSTGGFDKNFEIMAELDADETEMAALLIEEEIYDQGRPLHLEDLRQWVDKYQNQITELRKRKNKEENIEEENLTEIQRDLDTLLGYGNTEILETYIPVEGFVNWLQKNTGLPGAAMLIDRYHNRSHQNLGGHVQQSYAAVSHFLQQHFDHCRSLASKLESLHPEDIYQPDENLLDDWIRHLDDHAIMSGPGYDYAVLRGILPPSLGGTRLGGGGASSTLKRMMPLVARFLGEQ